VVEVGKRRVHKMGKMRGGRGAWSCFGFWFGCGFGGIV